MERPRPRTLGGRAFHSRQLTAPLLQQHESLNSARKRYSLGSTTASRVLKGPQQLTPFRMQETVSKRKNLLARAAAEPGGPRSFFRQMFAPMSRAIQAQYYRLLIGLLILVNLVCFVASTYEAFDREFGVFFDSVEAATSYVFLVDYCLRLANVTERRRWGQLGPVWGRVGWALSFEGILDALATFPYFIDTFVLHDILPSML